MIVPRLDVAIDIWFLKMLEQCIIFTKNGTILWEKTFSKLKDNPINTLISTVLLEDRKGGEGSAVIGPYMVKWTIANALDLLVVIVHQKILSLTYIEELLEIVKVEFLETYTDSSVRSRKPLKMLGSHDDFDKTFTAILSSVEKQALRKKPVKSAKAPASSNQKSVDKNQDTDSNILKDNNTSESTTEGGPVTDLFTSRVKKQGKVMKTGPRKKKGSKKEKEKKKKKVTKWEDSKLSTEEKQALDRSDKNVNEEEAAKQLEEMREQYIGSGSEGDDDNDSESDAYSSDNYSSASDSDSGSSTGWGFSSKVSGFFDTISGNKVLEKEDLEPVVDTIRNQLIGKNVASEVADDICESLLSSLVGTKLESFTRVSTVVKAALEKALVRILIPKKSTDVLREILAAKAEGRPYTIVFIGVNGVGKSTSLSKVCYYLKSKGIKMMLAACDTFRSGAVEQLSQHAKVLDVPLFERGYAKDPSAVAKDAVKHAAENGIDCVLIDTAGRMQNNEPLMRALAKLVSSNSPDLVLFVGEALVGNDGINQLELFDRALADYSTRPDPHRVDGIVLTKFDTIDDKVGTAVSMVYKTGQPIMFVGTGQKYTHLKKLNVRTVMRSLLS